MKIIRKALLYVLAFGLMAPLCGQAKYPKRGLSFGNGSTREKDLQEMSGSLSWFYNWGTAPESAVADVFEDYNIDFVPMAWNASFNESSMRNFYANHPDAKYLLGFNEPNFRAQANMTPSQAAAAWPKLEAIAEEYGLEIVGPAVNWCGECVSEDGVTYTNPYDYLDAFFAACPDCKVDYIAVHNYMCYAGPLIDYLDGFKKYGKKIWLTEFACWDQSNITLNMQKSFLIGALDYLDNDTMIYRYSWFIGRSGSDYPYLTIFESEAGKLSELGELYLNYNALHDTSMYYPVPARIEAESYSSMKGIAIEATSDFDGIANVGWLDPGDWMQYNIDVADSGSTYLYMRISANASAKLELRLDNESLGTMDIPSTGGWQNWKTFRAQIPLDSGRRHLKLLTSTGNFNVNWIRISAQDNTPPICSAGDDQEITLPANSATLAGNVTDIDGDSLVYKWTQYAGAACNIISPGSESTDVTGLKEGFYYFRLTVSDGYEVISDNVRIKVNANTTSIESTSSSTLSVYPNPVNNWLQIRLPEKSRIYRIEVLNSAGQIISIEQFSANKELAEVDFTQMGKGCYLVKLTSDNKVNLARVIK